MEEIKKVKLSGGPHKTVTWIWLDPETGVDSRSNIAMTVNEMDKLISLVDQNENSIIRWLEPYFKSLLVLKKAGKNGIDFSIERESWARIISITLLQIDMTLPL